jgi:hypothetical protein
VSRWRWYIHRLRAMPPAEIVHRMRHAAHRWRLRTLGPPAALMHTAVPDEPHLALSFADEHLPPLPETRARWERIGAQAKSPRRHTFALLGAPERDFGMDVDWHCDPMTGRRWPPDRSAWRIDYRHPGGLGEVKYVWELGRMPWLVPWAVAARVLGDAALARLAIDDILSFVRANPPYRGVHWTSGIEIGVRLVAWTWTLALIEPLATPTSDEWHEISRAVALAADFCRRFLSLYSSANNHLVAEGAALEIAGSAWPWLPHAGTFAALGRTILNCEIPRQVLPDGGSIEMCPAYLREVLVWSAVVARVRSQVGAPVPEAWRERWRAAAHLMGALCAGDEPLPALGDDDEGEVLPTGIHEPPRVLAALLRALADGTCPDESAVHSSALARLLLAPCSSTSAKHVLAPPDTAAATSPVAHNGGTAQGQELGAVAQRAEIFPSSGIVLIRTRRCRLVADFGPHGMPPIYAHAHADALTLAIDVDGAPALVDPGTYCYHSEPVWRDYFRSTRAHNTIEIGGRDQSQMRGPFLWGRVAHTRIVDAVERPDPLFVAEHDGYAPFAHRRSIRVTETDGFIIEDEVRAAPLATRRPRAHPPSPDVVLWWHFAPGTVTTSEHQIIWRGAHAALCLEWNSSAPARVTVHEGETTPPQGWFSPRFSVKVPAPAVAIRIASPTPPLRLTTHIGMLED